MSAESFSLLDPLATLAAAFTGAWFAFYLERSHKAEEEVTRRVGAANRGLYTIFNLWNVQETFRKEVIEPHRSRMDAWFNMAATIPTQYGITSFEAGELSFLLGLKSCVYTDLLLEEQRFALAMQLVKTRSEVIVQQAWRRLGEAGIAPLTPMSEPEQLL